MNCPNCGTCNNEGFKFCIKCGNSLENNLTPMEEPVATEEILTEQPEQVTQSPFQEVSTQPIDNAPVQNENISQAPIETTPSINTNTNTTSETLTETAQTVNTNTNNISGTPMETTQSVNTNNTSETKMSFMGYLSIILSVVLKPFTTFKEGLNKFDNIKNSAIMSLIVSGAGTLINLITTMINSVIVKKYDFFSGGYETTWVWENLKELNYLEVIGKNFLIYLGAIAAIAGIYYIASLIVKKQTNFSRLLGIAAIVVVPMLVCSLLLSPLLSLIWAELAMPITIIGAIYTIILTYEGMNNEVLLEGNIKYYLNLVCFSILGIAAYYLYMKLFMSSISNGLEDIMNLLG